MTPLVFAPLIAVVLIGAVAVVLQTQRATQRHLVGRVVEAPAPPGATPSILYFTGASCTICHTAQTPALRTLAAGLGDSIAIREIDVADDPALARSYRVMSLPTTIVLDAEQTVRHINVGFTPTATLREQLAAAATLVAA
jgi:thioredoxin-like negative regulator of GroEL